ncbi:2-(S)-hydroxypropyl-CoM dehydrogenase [Gemmata obscuriglobus]|uniref:Oxidoreductase n=1 Tax=Gemmata obscuriglobus TaxID=114 RepID=A0A2Z3H019_9BACT|nr:SDR family oxidoreductase [Gemmata obscuriglobus]AWM39058.1 oxidoreductase [Gemmata obscuriglobus]QEG27908.1 2-(S)-hydroxypropyl-CoM dehydrogenase [Gemmata obscuriglobus]VTS05342.1 2-deoxy-d-gluconate 3-dehydrogenase : Oxidoreductase, short chain dehydrogenase/reductase family OS=Acidobacterium capsulatum (strain ATCC 51196 / DSM 11244 / JCM 7670) GN=ACP_1727 PE=4 SV=1: adh_short_C2 [Gemmata obscuriglobus UQM 2246]
MSDIPAYVIVGAAGGIGSALCRRLAARGPCKLMLAGRDPNKLDALASDLTTAGATVAVRTLNAIDSGAVDLLFAEAGQQFGPITGAANLCGSILLKPAHLTTDQEFADTLAVNVTTAFNVLRAAVKGMPNGGSVVLMSTVATKIGLANHEAIAAAKGAVNGLVISAAATYAGRNLRVNAVAPGLVRTPLAARLTSSEATLKASTAMHPLGRIGEPGDVADAIAWLLAPETTWVTGQIVSVDGGLSSVRAK